MSTLIAMQKIVTETLIQAFSHYRRSYAEIITPTHVPAVFRTGVVMAYAAVIGLGGGYGAVGFRKLIDLVTYFFTEEHKRNLLYMYTAFGHYSCLL